MNKLCSKCHKDFNGCQCLTFQPNVSSDLSNAWIGPPSGKAYEEIAEIVRIIKEGEVLSINRKEGALLMKYFLNVGYISYEDYPEVHLFINRLKEFLES